MPLSETPLFYSSTLLFSEASMERLEGAVVGVAGVGGVGAIATEMLARLGIGAFRIADPDVYEAVNMSRQIFATTETLGRNKAAVAAERLRSINPGCCVEALEHGITLANIRAFCEGADVLLCQCDRESSKTLLHRAAKAMALPVVSGGRSSIHDHRWKVKAAVYNYRDRPDLPCYDEVFHPDMTAVPFEELTEPLLRRYDEKVTGKDRGVFEAIALERPELFASISPEDLVRRLETTERYQKRHVCSVLANTAGCLVATAALKVLLGGPEASLELNLWDA
jgi:molybdopterin/thiamine biosynthesis adenylyltransferase